MLKQIAETIKKWWVYLILGIIYVVVAGYAIAVPGVSFLAVKGLFVAALIASSVVEIAQVIANRDEIPAWGWNLVASILVLTLAVTVAVTPGLAATLITFAFAFAFVFNGFKGIGDAFTLKKSYVKGWGWVLVFAILTLVLGIMLLYNPLSAVLSIDRIAAFALLAEGIKMIAISISLSKVNSMVKKAEKDAEAFEAEVKEGYKKLEKMADDYQKEVEAAVKEREAKIEGVKAEIKKQLAEGSEEDKQ